jgi:hypothetical protein
MCTLSKTGCGGLCVVVLSWLLLAVGMPASTVLAATATTMVISSTTPESSVVGQTVLIEYRVEVSGSPTGNVTVSDGTQSCVGTAATQQCTIAFTSPGTKSLVADYAGDADFDPSTSVPYTHVVYRAATTTALSAEDNPDGSVTFSVVVTVDSPGAGTPSGTVSFVVEGATLGTAALDAAGEADFTTSDLPATRTLITAAYDGDDDFEASDASLYQPSGLVSAEIVEGACGCNGVTPVLMIPLILLGIAGMRARRA